MPDFLDEKKQEIRDRLKELKPFVEEYETLSRMLDASGGPLPEEPQQPAKPKRSRRRGSHGGSTRTSKTTARANGGTGRRGRPKGSGTRAAEALALVQANPGITIPELAQQMGIKQNYLYRVLPGLAEDGLVSKDETTKGWHPKGQ